MPKIPSLSSVAKKELFTFSSIFFVLLIAFFYIIFSLITLNHQLIFETTFSPFPLIYKLTLFSTLLLGFFTAFSLSDVLITLLSSLLVGINLVLIIKTLFLLEHQGKVRLSVGGATVISLITTGCSSCGFSLLSVIGLGTSFSFLPFHGMELHVASVVLLIVSTWYLIQKIRDSVYCKVRI